MRNDLWKGRSPERFYEALAWLYGWKVENCLACLNDILPHLLGTRGVNSVKADTGVSMWFPIGGIE